MTRYLEPKPRKLSTAVIQYNILDCHDAKIASFATPEEARDAVDFSKDQCISKVKGYK